MAVFPNAFPRRGEIYMVDFDPARGSEQAGYRPALIVSNDVNNQRSAVVMVAGITTTIPERDYPINVHLPAGELPHAGTIMCAQVLTISKDRLQRHRGRIDAALQQQVDAALKVALGLPR